MQIEDVRSLFPITAKRSFFMSGGLSPASQPAVDAITHWVEIWATDPNYHYDRLNDDWEACRERFAKLIGADASEVAITDCTSRGANLAAQMIDSPPGSNVVFDSFAYPSDLYPWRLPAKSGVEIRTVQARDYRIELDDLARAIDDRTVAVNVCQVSAETGFRYDLAEVADLAHSRGAYFVVDAAQSAGTVQIDADKVGVDFLSTTAMKYLLGAPGVGYMYVASRHIDRLTPPQAGYASVENPFAHDLSQPMAFLPKATRYEVGMPNLVGLAACRAGMDILLELGMDKVERYVLDLAGYCMERLLEHNFRLYTPLDEKHRAGVIGLPVERGGDLYAFLRERGIDVGTMAGLLRFDMHIFNNRDDIDRLIAGLDEFVRINGREALQTGEDRRRPWIT
jgi:cysteine desulfurase / selenocysteine lyase